MLVVTNRQDAISVRGICADDDCDDSIQLLGLAGVNALDSRMRMRRVQNLADQNAGKRQVVGVFARAGSLAGGVNHGDGLADYREIRHSTARVGTGALARPVERSSK